MKQGYFIVNGAKYHTGSIFIIKDMGKNVEASFLYYDTDKQRYFYKIKDCVWNVDNKNFWRMFVSTTDKRDESMRAPTTKTKNDIEIPGLFIGWVWYIFLMAISVIFNGAIFFWILYSVIFFKWREKKIKEEGTYVEW